MASPVVPATPAAPAPSAPTPAPSPAPTPTPTPATPDPAPAVPATPDAPTPAAPSTDAPAAPQPGGPPKQEDYSEDAEGLEQFLNDRKKYQEEHPDDKPAEAPPADQQQAPAEDNPADAPKPEEKPADAAPPNPQKLDEWTSKDPAFKAALDANPELKGELFALARMNERAKPILDIVATPEEAQFAVENANAFVDLRTNLMLSVEEPDRLPATFDKVQDLFRIRDKDGNYVKDAAGNYEMAEDYGLLRSQFVNDGVSTVLNPLKTKVEELKARLQNGVYPNAEAKTKDEKALEDAEYGMLALEYSRELLSGTASEDALPELPADATPEQKAFQERLRQQQQELDKNKKQNTREQRVTARKEFQKTLNLKWGAGIGKMLDEAIASEKESGGVIPDFILQEKWVNPQTGQKTQISNFAMSIKLDFDNKVYTMPAVKQKLAELQMMPPGAESEAAASAYYADLRTKYLPDIIRAHIEEVQKGILEYQGKRDQQRSTQTTAATVEPRSGATPTPQSLSSKELNMKAKENAAKLPGYEEMSPEEKLEMELQERYKLRGLA